MFTLIVENESNEQLELTNSEAYDVIKIDGLTPSGATINTSSVAGLDGTRFNSASIAQRNLVIYLNIKSPVEENRQQLYKYFRVKRKCKIYFKNQNRDVFIEGYVETFEADLFGMTQQPQISIICPEPFFKAVDEILVEFSNTLALFEFPFSIPEEGIEFSRIESMTTKYINAGDIETGAIITLSALSNQILNPIIYNRTSNEFFKLAVDLSEGDTLVIDTNKGEKSVRLIKSGVETNLLNKITSGSTWLQFQPGVNEISYDADEGAANLKVNVAIAQKYGGV